MRPRGARLEIDNRLLSYFAPSRGISSAALPRRPLANERLTRVGSHSMGDRIPYVRETTLLLFLSMMLDGVQFALAHHRQGARPSTLPGAWWPWATAAIRGIRLSVSYRTTSASASSWGDQGRLTRFDEGENGLSIAAQ